MQAQHEPTVEQTPGLPVYSMMKAPFLMSCRARTPHPQCSVRNISMDGLASKLKGLQNHATHAAFFICSGGMK